VKDATDNMCRVELHTNCKTVNVERNKLIIIDEKRDKDRMHRTGPASSTAEFASHPGAQTPLHPGAQTPSAWEMNYPQTPSRTPNMFDGSATPLGSRTPLPDDSIWNPGSRTPFRTRDDFMDPQSIPNDWGASFPTPSFNKATPNMETNTPSGYSTSAAGYPTTPSSELFTPAGYNQPATNSWDSYGDHATPTDAVNTPSASIHTPQQYPQTPSTPGVLPQTPSEAAFEPLVGGVGIGGVGGDAHLNFRANNAPTEDGSWVCPDIEVLVDINNKSIFGVVSSVTGKRECKVFLPSSNEYITVTFDHLKLVSPQKNDKVKIIGREMNGKLGVLIGIDDQDGIVKMDQTAFEIKIMNMANLAKFYNPPQ